MTRASEEAKEFLTNSLGNPTIPQFAKDYVVQQTAVLTARELQLRQAILDVRNGSLTIPQRRAALDVILRIWRGEQ